MAVGGPVKRMWPHEKDFTHDPYRPSALVNAGAGEMAAGDIAMRRYCDVSPWTLGQRGATLPATGDSQGFEACIALPYAVGLRVLGWVRQDAPIPLGFWRSVGASINTFAVESAMDELTAGFGHDAHPFHRSRASPSRSGWPCWTPPPALRAGITRCWQGRRAASPSAWPSTPSGRNGSKSWV